jgi:hypothetical protein
MALADNAARKAGEKLPAFKPKEKKFDWAEGYMDFVMSGGQADAMTMGGATQGKDLVQSGINIGQGKGSAGDYLTVGLAPFALAGFGAGAGAAAAVRATKPSADLARAYNQLARTLAKPQVTHMTTLEGLQGIVGSGGRLKTAVSDGVKQSPGSYGDFTTRQSIIPDDPVYGVFLRGNPNLEYKAPRPGTGYFTGATNSARMATQLPYMNTRQNPVFDYGAIGINFNPNVSRQSTATVGDSVGWAPMQPKLSPTGEYLGATSVPPTRLSPGASAQQIREAAKTANAEQLTSPFFRQPLPYLEAQIPKELATLQNAKSISVPTAEGAAQVTELLRSAGINTKVVVRKTKDYKQPLVEKAIEALGQTMKRAGYKRDALRRKINELKPRKPVDQISEAWELEI